MDEQSQFNLIFVGVIALIAALAAFLYVMVAGVPFIVVATAGTLVGLPSLTMGVISVVVGVLRDNWFWIIPGLVLLGGIWEE